MRSDNTQDQRLATADETTPRGGIASPLHPLVIPMNNQRLRNLTTGRLHTKMEDIYKDVEFLTGAEGVFTHQLPNAFQAMQSWLREQVTDERFWDGEFDTTHEGETAIRPMSDGEQAAFWKRYGELPHPFAALMG